MAELGQPATIASRSMKTSPTDTRTNAQWLADLRSPGPVRETALADLRAIVVSGLRLGLVGSVETAGPEFEPLAEDFAQQALLRVLAGLDSFRGRSQFTTWAHKIAVRVALTELRRQRWQDVSLESLLERGSGEAGFMADPAPGPEIAAEQADMMAQLRRIMLEELTDKQGQAIMAVAVRGMPIEEAARRMGMERNALYKLLHDARVRLKNRMARAGLTPEAVLAVFEQG